jgi:Sulfotransferase domain
MLQITLKIWTAGDWQNRAKLQEGFYKHYEHVMSIVPKDRLLEFRSEDGWAPLCEFLDKPVPRGPYPHVNKGNNLVYLHCILFGVTALKIFAKGAVWAAVGVAIWAAWCYSEYSRM